ncbi:MAG: DUF1343 domain-containing protein [Phycisphaeraceae bacterium]|nr:DUF1343 domain-containing protein [Phycisphaeraceae bacterium]
MNRTAGATALLLLATLGAPRPGLGAETDPPEVLPGIDVLVQQKFAPLAGRRVGLITNHTGVDRRGRRTVDLLHAAPEVTLVALFSPEHGLRGVVEGGEKVGAAVDRTTQLPVYSLYGETRRPTAAALRNLDTLVFDIQDVGTRFYTYIATMAYAMEAAAEHDKRFVVLDRPNPITGRLVAGPLTDPDKLHFIAPRSIPVVHGMTVGELAGLFNKHFKIGCDLQVVTLRRWRRSMGWKRTGLKWINPSPNIRRPAAAWLYPSIGLLEMTNLSVGRGTGAPFERLGAPWIKGEQLAAALQRAETPGLAFAATTFTPEASRFQDHRCGGVTVALTDPKRYAPVRCGLTIARVIKDLYGERFEHEKVQTMLRNDRAHRAWQQGSIEKVAESWAGPLEQFKTVRARHLLYD